MQQRIGIDVGGTNTDAVLMQDREVVGWVKTLTSTQVLQVVGPQAFGYDVPYRPLAPSATGREQGP